MKVQMTGRHMTLTNSLKQRAEKEVAQFEKFFEKVVSTHVTFDTNKTGFDVTIEVKVYKEVLTTTAKGETAFSALEICTDKMKRRLRAHKEKLKERKRHAEPTHEAVKKIRKTVTKD